MSWEVVSCWIESHPGLASWVQAVGSVVAIFVAIYIANGQFRKALTDRKEQEKVVIAGLISLADRAAYAVERMHRNVSPIKRSAEDVAYVKSSLASFVAIDLMKLLNAGALEQVLIVRANLEVALQQEALCHEIYESESARKAHGLIQTAGICIRGAQTTLQLLQEGSAS